MRLRNVTALILSTTVLLALGAIYLFASRILVKGFTELERSDTRQNVERAVDGLGVIIDNLNTKSGDWAAWDDTYRFVVDRNQAYVDSNLNDQSLDTLHINGVIFLDPDGHVVHRKDYSADIPAIGDVTAELVQFIQDNPLVHTHADPGSSRAGLIVLPSAAVLVSSRPITTSERTGPIRGTLVFYRILGDDLVKTLGDRTHLSVTMMRLDVASFPPDCRDALPRMCPEQPTVISANDKAGVVSGFRILRDVLSRDALLLRVDIPRRIFHQGQASLVYLLMSILAVSLVMMGTTLVLLGSLVLARLESMSRDVDRIGRGDLKKRLRVGGPHELSSLAARINGMLDTIHESEAKHRLILDAALDAVLEMDEQGRITAWNPQAERVFGYTAAEALGRDLGELIVPPDMRAPHTSGIARYLKTGEAHLMNRRVEVTACRRTGERFPAELAITPVRSGGKVIFNAFLRDITERKGAEEQLRSARDAAESASRAKSEFLANMSHEIRTPMTSMLGYADLLMDPAQSEVDRAACIATIRRSGEDLLTILNDVLDISKIEAGRMTVEKIPTHVGRVVNDVYTLMRDRAEKKELKFEIECAGPVPMTIQSDPFRLRQILVNLVGNAIKFTETGYVRVVISFLPGAPTAPDRLRFEILDSGIGLTPEQIPGLFKPFTQGDSSTTRKYGGSGLGLTISGRLAQALGGNIQVASTPRQGSTFSLTIETGPVEGVRMVKDLMELSGAEGGSAESPAAAPAPSDAREVRFRARILLVEDGVDNQRLIAHLLRKAGAEVEIVENGQLAVERGQAVLLQGLPYDLILMDMQMPVLDGYGAATALRRLGYSAPIVALTAHAMAGDRDRCLRAGCDDYATKPIHRGALLNICRSWIEAGRKAREQAKDAA